MFKTSVQVVHRILGRMMFSFSFFFTVEILAQGALSFTSLVLPSGQGIFFFYEMPLLEPQKEWII